VVCGHRVRRLRGSNSWVSRDPLSHCIKLILSYSLTRDANPWSLDPFSEIRNDDHSIVERGKGNANSVEFNLLYRWHATLSEPDVAWLERIFAASFGGKPADQITMEDFKGVRLTFHS
jgi:hypothetical protein